MLSGQNDSLRRETEKLKAELAELDAFMDDLEAETELKSMCGWTKRGRGEGRRIRGPKGVVVQWQTSKDALCKH